MADPGLTTNRPRADLKSRTDIRCRPFLATENDKGGLVGTVNLIKNRCKKKFNYLSAPLGNNFFGVIASNLSFFI